jgi:nitrogen fixation/metabolism regulation signal transduction histidine kinase
MATLMRRFARWRSLVPTLFLLGFLLIVMILMGRATTNSAKFGQMYAWLLLFSTIGLSAMSILILYHLVELIRLYRRRIPGSRLTLRLAGIFAALAITPVTIVYGFSIHFLQKGIDSWFNVQVDRGLEDALELSRTALDLRMREVLRQTLRIAENISEKEDDQVGQRLDELLDTGEASELTLFSQNGRIIATVTLDTTAILPSQPPDMVLLHVRQGNNYVGLEPIGDNSFYIRVVVKASHRNNDGRELQALFPITDRLGFLAEAVRIAFDSYRELVFLRVPLRVSFTLTLSLVLLLAILAAFWAAFYTAHRMVRPLQELADGTKAVAAGHFNKQLADAGSDELGFLVESFNQMIRNLAQAHDDAQRSQALVESQRTYLETVLARLSSGVIIVDQTGRLQTCNTAASQILEINLQEYVGADSEWIAIVQPSLQDFIGIISPHLMTIGDWRQEITWFGKTGRCILLCRGSSLPDAVGVRGGHVIVFDDITNLVKAERDAAWAEVARRLAHEIKNPLTPIQLATERIRHKYLKQFDEDQGKVLDRGTHTIIQQVQAMKEMVDAFNEYARPPRLRLGPLELSDFITEVLYLYRDYPVGVEIKLDLIKEQLWINADKVRLRQLLHNLVKNAIEAICDGKGSTLWISTRCKNLSGTKCAEMSVRDNGSGFPNNILSSAFEPYVTTKPKGTGLGLAIVKKIVEEHGGWIQLETQTDGGARVVIRLPIYQETVRSLTLPTIPDVLSHTGQESTG